MAPTLMAPADRRADGGAALDRAPPPRVLFLSDHLGYAHGTTHGATTYFLNVLPPLASRVELTFCLLRERHPAAARLEAEGVRPIFLGRHRSDPRALFDLVDLIREGGIRIVHAAGMKGILLGRMAARRAGARSIIHLHDLHRPGRALGAVQRMLASGTDAALAVSGAVADLAERDFAIPRERVRVLYNPLPIGRYARPAAGARERLRAEFAIAPMQPVIGVIGRLSPEKGHEQLLRALPAVLGSVPDAVVLAAGDGPLRRACEELASRLGLSGAVRFAGYRDDVPDVLAAVDVVAVPSVTEGCPYAALEAMASRRPVVAFAVGGVPEIVRHEINGLLAPAGDVDALAGGIVRVIRDEALAARLIAAGVKDVEHLSLESHVSRLVAIYREAAANPPGTPGREERGVGSAWRRFCGHSGMGGRRRGPACTAP